METFQEFLKEEKCFKFLKWIEVIQREDLAVKSSSMYILERDKIWCDVIFIDDKGNKRKISGGSVEQMRQYFSLLDLSNLSEENIEIWKDKLGGLQGPPGPAGDISVLSFDVTDDMRLIMQLETNTDLNFELNNGHLILIK